MPYPFSSCSEDLWRMTPPVVVAFFLSLIYYTCYQKSPGTFVPKFLLRCLRGILTCKGVLVDSSHSRRRAFHRYL